MAFFRIILFSFFSYFSYGSDQVQKADEFISKLNSNYNSLIDIMKIDLNNLVEDYKNNNQAIIESYNILFSMLSISTSSKTYLNFCNSYLIESADLPTSPYTDTFFNYLVKEIDLVFSNEHYQKFYQQNLRQIISLNYPRPKFNEQEEKEKKNEIIKLWGTPLSLHISSTTSFIRAMLDNFIIKLESKNIYLEESNKNEILIDTIIKLEKFVRLLNKDEKLIIDNDKYHLLLFFANLTSIFVANKQEMTSNLSSLAKEDFTFKDFKEIGFDYFQDFPHEGSNWLTIDLHENNYYLFYNQNFLNKKDIEGGFEVAGNLASIMYRINTPFAGIEEKSYIEQNIACHFSFAQWMVFLHSYVENSPYHNVANKILHGLPNPVFRIIPSLERKFLTDEEMAQIDNDNKITNKTPDIVVSKKRKIKRRLLNQVSNNANINNKNHLKNQTEPPKTTKYYIQFQTQIPGKKKIKKGFTSQKNLHMGWQKRDEARTRKKKFKRKVQQTPHNPEMFLPGIFSINENNAIVKVNNQSLNCILDNTMISPFYTWFYLEIDELNTLIYDWMGFLRKRGIEIPIIEFSDLQTDAYNKLLTMQQNDGLLVNPEINYYQSFLMAQANMIEILKDILPKIPTIY